MFDTIRKLVNEKKLQKSYIIQRVLHFSSVCIEQVYFDLKNTLKRENIMTEDEIVKLDEEYEEMKKNYKSGGT